MMRKRAILVVILLILIVPSSLSFAENSASEQSRVRQDEAAPLYKIGEVQGSITGNPQTFNSPLRNERVRVSGVVTNLIMLNTDSREVNGFFLQETPENSDGDPLSSDGIQAIIGAPTEFGGYTPVAGDIITIEGKVGEYYYNTRLTALSFISLDGHVDDLDAAVPAVELNPLGDIDEVSLAYESAEGMRVSIPAGSVIVSATHIFSSTNDTEIYVIRGDHPVAQRENPFERRVFRDSHELDDGILNGNPYRISVEGNILKAIAGDYAVNLPAYNTYDVFTSELTGNLVYAYERYTVQIDSLPSVESPVSPIDNAPVPVPERSSQYSIATFNVENLYDYYNDGFDPEDTPGDGRLNYVPRSVEEYEAKVIKVALAILEYLHAPDIIAFQELEDQDVCVSGGQLTGTCGDVNNADGSPDVLQDVAAVIAELTNGEVVYLAALDRDSADERGITQGYLYRADRVELPEASADNPVLGSRTDDEQSTYYAYNQEVSNPKSLNMRIGPGTHAFERPPLVGLFRIHREAVGSDDYIEIYLSNNHLKSDPESFQGLRQQGTQFNVSFVHALQSENPDVYFAVLGDLNSFYDSVELSFLEPSLENLWYLVPAEARYTYIYAGQTQTLDYIYATPSLVTHLDSARIAHISSDFSYSYGDDATNGLHAGDHDPVVATFNFPE